MVQIIFRFKDEYTHGEWQTRNVTMQSLEECETMYGLKDCEHEIISVIEL